MSDDYEKDMQERTSDRNLILLGCRADADIDYRDKKIKEQQKQIDKLNKERAGWMAVTSEMESEINELKAGEDWYKNRLAELKR